MFGAFGEGYENYNAERVHGLVNYIIKLSVLHTLAHTENIPEIGCGSEILMLNITGCVSAENCPGIAGSNECSIAFAYINSFSY